MVGKMESAYTPSGVESTAETSGKLGGIATQEKQNKQLV